MKARARAGITQNTVLESDVGPCSGTGIDMGPKRTLDLNGHRVFAAPPPSARAPIRVFRRTGVTVKRGTVSRFAGGVVIEGGSRNTVTQIMARDNIARTPTLYGDGMAILSSQNNRGSEQPHPAEPVLQNAALPPLNVNIARFDMRDTNFNCDNNQWVANLFGTANMPCIQ